MSRRVLAVGAHADDVEFGAAGTLEKFAKKGWDVHIWTVADGSCGTAQYNAQEIIKIREKEAENSAKIIGATYHHGIVNDLSVYVTKELTQRACALIREINPEIIFLPSPRDYMNEHERTATLIVDAAFSKAMRNYAVEPPARLRKGPIYLYHMLAHGLRDGMNQITYGSIYIDISDGIKTKEKMLACHESQGHWLSKSQRTKVISKMRATSGEVAKMAQLEWRIAKQLGYERETRMPVDRWKYVEGFVAHNRLGYAPEKDRLAQVLRNYAWVDPLYKEMLELAPGLIVAAVNDYLVRRMEK